MTELAASEPAILSQFGMFGVVKETGVVRETNGFSKFEGLFSADGLCIDLVNCICIC